MPLTARAQEIVQGHVQDKGGPEGEARQPEFLVSNKTLAEGHAAVVTRIASIHPESTLSLTEQVEFRVSFHSNYKGYCETRASTPRVTFVAPLAVLIQASWKVSSNGDCPNIFRGLRLSVQLWLQLHNFFRNFTLVSVVLLILNVIIMKRIFTAGKEF